MSRGRGSRTRPGFGQSKHRGARVQRFGAKHRGSEKIACLGCGKPRKKCICR